VTPVTKDISKSEGNLTKPTSKRGLRDKEMGANMGVGIREIGPELLVRYREFIQLSKTGILLGLIDECVSPFP
jgi:hypothetical protein